MRSNKLLIGLSDNDDNPVITFCTKDKHSGFFEPETFEMLKFHQVQSSLEECIATATENVSHMNSKDLSLPVLGQFDGSVSCKSSDSEDMEFTSGAGDGTWSESSGGISIGELCGYEKNGSLPQMISIVDINSDVLQSGAAIYLGSCDHTRENAPVVAIFCNHDAWSLNNFNTAELTKLLLYYYTVQLGDGLTLIVDARGATSVVLNVLLETLGNLESQCPGAVNITHILVDRNAQTLLWQSSYHLPHIQIDLLMSLEAMYRVIDRTHLPLELGGLRSNVHMQWIHSRQLESFLKDCQLASGSLCCVARHIGSTGSAPTTRREAERLLEWHAQRVDSVLEQPLSTMLCQGRDTAEEWLHSMLYNEGCLVRSTDLNYTANDAVQLYGYLCRSHEQLRHLAESKRSNLCRWIHLRRVEEEICLVLNGLFTQGNNVRKQFCGTLADSVQGILAQQQNFQSLHSGIIASILKGKDRLLEFERMLECDEFRCVKGYGNISSEVNARIASLSHEMEQIRARIETAVQCYQLIDKAYEWAMEVTKHVADMTLDKKMLAVSDVDELLSSLSAHILKHPPIDEYKFKLAEEWCSSMNDARLAVRCRTAHAKCNEVLDMINYRRQKLLKLRRTLHSQLFSSTSMISLPRSSGEKPDGGVILRPPRLFMLSDTDDNLTLRRRSYAGKPSTPMCSTSATAFKRRDLDIEEYEEYLFSEGLITEDMSDRIVASLPKGLSDSTMRGSRESLRSSRDSLRGSQDSLHILSRSESVSSVQSVDGPADYSSTTSLKSEWAIPKIPALRKFLFQKSVSTDQSIAYDRQVGGGSAGKKSGSCLETEIDTASICSMSDTNIVMSRVMSEMVETERDYVSSLKFTIDVYLNAMATRDDVPQPLKGKRNIIFGNIEKIYEFHNQMFLTELERSRDSPLNVGDAFLRHTTSFFLYAMYNKKEKSTDCLMSEYGTAYFKRQQNEQGDKLDVGSYLLKPVQRMGKYALLLGQIIKQCPEGNEEKLTQLKEALEMVKFQLRHGNDLLAMDCIKDCDVNLQEQGMLLRQEEFVVWQGRKKSQRHIFLFEDMILLSKTKRKVTGCDCYAYKNSFKMSDVGLTERPEACGDDTKFEIWFRKRSPTTTFTVHSDRVDVKRIWVREITRLLLRQAIRSRERTLTETTRMGLGRKPSVVLKNDTAESKSRESVQRSFTDMAVINRVPRMRNSIAVSTFDRFRGLYKGQPLLNSFSSSPSGWNDQASSLCTTMESPFEESGHDLQCTEAEVAMDTGSRQNCTSALDSSPNSFQRYSLALEREGKDSSHRMLTCTIDVNGLLCTDV